jgi:hypothetical protein
MLDQANFVKSTCRMLQEMLIMLRLLGRSGRRNLLYEAIILWSGIFPSIRQAGAIF